LTLKHAYNIIKKHGGRGMVFVVPNAKNIVMAYIVRVSEPKPRRGYCFDMKTIRTVADISASEVLHSFA